MIQLSICGCASMKLYFLRFKYIRMSQQQKQRSELLRKQISQMGEDFEYMKKNKEEWKKQLQARFQDIEKKIQSSKQYITNQAKKTNDTLLAFQHKFEFQLKKTKDDLNTNINKLSESTTNNFAEKTKELQQFNQKLKQEIAQRNHQHDDGMKENRDKFDKTNEALQKEKDTRIKNQKDNMGKITQSITTIRQKIKEQKDERNLKLSQLRKTTDHELNSQKAYNTQFHTKCHNDFDKNLSDLKNQMQQRFSSKDEIINSLMSIVKTLQDTLRHPH